MKIGEFFAELGFNVKDGELKKFNTGIGSFLKKTILLQVAVLASGVAMSRMTNNVAQGVAQLEKFAQNTGLAIDQLEKWQEAGQKIDITLNKENITSSIASLQRNLDEIKFGRGDMGAFQILGVEIGNKDAFQVLEDIRDRIQGLNRTEVRNLVEKMGLDASFVQLLKTSRGEFERLAEQTRLSSSQRGGLLQFGKQVKTLELNLIALKNQIASALAPSLSKFYSSLNKFIKDNSKNIIQGFKAIANAVSIMSKAIYNAVRQVVSIFKTTLDVFQDLLGMKAGLIVFGAVLARMFLPLKAIFTPVKIFFALLIGLLDDIITWKEGGDSLFGGLYDWITDLIDKMKPLYDWIIKIKKEWFGDMSGGEIKGGANSNEPQETTLTDKLAFAGKNALKWGIGGAVAGSVIPGVGTITGGIASALAGFLQGFSTAMSQDALFKDIREGFANQAYLDKGLTPPQSNNKTDIVNNMSFNIKSTDPKEAGSEVYSVLTGELKSTIVY
jgi:hypothetical protein